MGERYYRYDKWDIVFTRSNELPQAPIFSSVVTLTIPESEKEQELCLVTSSGDILVENLDNVHLSIRSENGSISVEDTNAATISASTENGSVQLKNTTSTGNIITQSDYGTVTVALGDSNTRYSVNIETENQASITINSRHYKGGKFTVGAGGEQEITLKGENNAFILSNVPLFNAPGFTDFNKENLAPNTADCWTENEFISFIQDQEQQYKVRLTSGDITQQEYNTFISTDKALLREIQNGAKILKSATGKVENGIGA